MAARTSTIRQETDAYFESEYEKELETWVRRRFRNLCICLIVILLLTWSIAYGAFLLLVEEGHSWKFNYYETFEKIFLLGIVIWFLTVTRRRLDTKEQLIRSATRLIMLLSIVDVSGTIIGYTLGVTENTTFNVVDFFFWHFVACLFLPWTPLQSLKAIGPAYLIWIGAALAHAVLQGAVPNDGMENQLLIGIFVVLYVALLTMLLFLPGMAICWWRLRRHGRKFKTEVLGREFLSMRRELKQARRIHDALFPSPFADDACSFAYDYSPHSDIGGDFVSCSRVGDKVRLLLIDVTGHGLSAAMTVNRIHGEVERIFGEYPDADPARLIQLLDRYFVLTMAPHNIFATGLALELDLSSGRIKWVNAGHPPAFAIGIAESTRELETTTILLGAMETSGLEPDQQETCIEPGSVIVAYTDGVIESRDPAGRMLGLDRVRDLMENGSSDENWMDRISNLVSTHARGAFEDDVLIVELKYLAAPRAVDPTDDKHMKDVIRA